MTKTILVVDDSANIRQALAELLQDEGYVVTSCESGEAGLQKLAEERFGAMLLDVRLPGIDGIATLKRVHQLQPELSVIMISGHADLETAVQATRLGAYNFLEKPLSPEKVLLEIKNIFARQQVELEMHRLKNLVELDYQLIGDAPPMRQLREEINRAAPSSGRIFIFGENGTGKELVAHEIHRKSRRGDKPFIKVNCAAIPKELIESELFGHQKGAFTGAIKTKIGVFEEANGGTLLLDEIGDMALETQAKLLRVLQENEFVRVGGTTPIPFDVRIISATNQDLGVQIAAGRFREDLFFRINVIPIRVPALRERLSDIPLLARHFFQLYSLKNGVATRQISDDSLVPLLHYHWPGNIRELKNIVDRLLIMGERTALSRQDVIHLLPELKFSPEIPSSAKSPETSDLEPPPLKNMLENFEKNLLRQYFQQVHGNVSRLAELLHTDRANLHRKLKKFGIK
jgi:two-component system nitrogen regulation response regulator NtrX